VSDAPALRESVLQRRLSLGDMLDLPTFHELVRSFVELYQVSIKVFDAEGSQLAAFKVGHGDFCGYVFSFSEGRTRCTNTVGRVKDGPVQAVEGARPAQLPEGEPNRGMVTVPCFTGMRYLIQPILWEGDVLGRIVFGPFIPDDFGGLPTSLTEISKDLDREQSQLLMSRIRRAPESVVAKVVTHFSQLLETLVAAGQKTYLTSQLHIEATLDTNKELEAKNKKLEDANARLKELDRLKSSFLATVSHELRTPLTSIIGYSEMLSEGLAGPLNKEQADYVSTIMDKGETLLRLITSILDISQIEAGKVRLNFEPLDVSEVISSSVSSVKPQAQKKGVVLETKVADNRPRASADREKLKQVVVNLLANAVKFTPKDGKVSVFLSELGYQAELGTPGYRILVEDSGVGIPQDQFDKIFESFYQVDSSSTREFGGAGLGLAIVKSFVEGHGGMVRVASEHGRGARFTVILPATPPQPRTAHIAPPVVTEAVADRF
jgi:two-component system sensor histidine kinase BarA